MRLFRRWFFAAADALVMRAARRKPDFVIGGHDNPYLLRWYLTPWRRWHAQARNAAHPTVLTRVKGWLGFVLPSVYLHLFLRSDDDRALHDHPWFWCSILLHGRYAEHTIKAGGVHVRRERRSPSVRLSTPWRAHRVELYRSAFGPMPCWTIFITGPRMREWGFHCKNGWVHWKVFTAADDPGSIGRGCGEV